MTNLFGFPECELGDGSAVALVTDEWGAGWLCKLHLVTFLILQASIGRTLTAWLREKR
jgi:hypothetical protein